MKATRQRNPSSENDGSLFERNFLRSSAESMPIAKNDPSPINMKPQAKLQEREPNFIRK